MHLHERGTEDVRERRDRRDDVEVGEAAAPGRQVVARLEGAPEGERAGGMRGGAGQDGVPEQEEVRDRSQHGHHGQQQTQ
jgi:hypothetical protein